MTAKIEMSGVFKAFGPKKVLRGVDLSVPLYQDVNGYRLGTDYTLTAGWQFAF